MTSNPQRMSTHRLRLVIIYFGLRVRLRKRTLTMYIPQRCAAIASLVYAAHPRGIYVAGYMPFESVHTYLVG